MKCPALWYSFKKWQKLDEKYHKRHSRNPKHHWRISPEFFLIQAFEKVIEENKSKIKKRGFRLTRN